MKRVPEPLNPTFEPIKRIRSTLLTGASVIPLGRTGLITINIMDTPPQNHTYNVNIQTTNIDQRVIDTVMTLTQAKQANIEELRREIIKIKKAGVAEAQVVKLQCILGSNTEASPKEIKFLAEYYARKGDFLNAIKHYERILKLDEVSHDAKIIILKILIKFSQQKDNPEEIIYFCNLLINTAAQNSLDQAWGYITLLRIHDIYNLHEGYHIEARIYYSQKILSNDEVSIDDKKQAFQIIKNCIVDLEDPITLLNLANSFSKDNQPELAKSCLNHIPGILDQLSLEERSANLRALCIIHFENKNWNEAINTGEQYYNNLLALGNQDSKELTNFLNVLKDLCIQNNNTEKAIEFCHKILLTEGACPFDKIDTLKSLIDLYTEVNKKIECLEALLAIPEASISYRLFARNELLKIYLQAGDTDNAIEYYKEIIKTSDVEENIIIDFLKTPTINLEGQLNKIREKNSEIQKELLLVLSENPGLWHGKHKLDDIQWENILNTDCNSDQIFDLVFSQYVTMHDNGYSFSAKNPHTKVSLNLTLFLNNDSNQSNWNMLPQRAEPLTEGMWNNCINNSNTVLDKFCKIRSQETTHLDNFIYKCLENHDQENIQFISKRIIAVVDVLENLFSQLNEENVKLSVCENENILKVIHGAFDIMTEGGKRCSDGASTALNDVENYLKLFQNPQYQANIFINLFKLYAIQDKLTDKDHIENIETHRYYATKFNSLLGLGLSDETIHFEDQAKTIPLEEALPILSKSFTAEALINFTIGSHVFEMLFPIDEKVAKDIKQLEEKYDDTLDIKDSKERYEAETAILTKIDNLKTSFYKDKAIQMYTSSGFLLSNGFEA